MKEQILESHIQAFDIRTSRFSTGWSFYCLGEGFQDIINKRYIYTMFDLFRSGILSDYAESYKMAKKQLNQIRFNFSSS